LADLERALGYSFRDGSLLVRAVTHSSRANEALSPMASVAGAPANGALADNERLEFLGDAILGWLVSECLFERFSAFTEGQLSLVKNHLVSATHLVDAAQALDLGRYLQLGRGEETAGGRNKLRLLVNAFEAVLAAVYLDGGPEAARSLVARYAIPADDVLFRMAGAGPPQDFRAELERLARDRNFPKPEYTSLGESGPGHARKYTVEVRVGKDVVVAGEGSSKKTASHRAAREACLRIRGEGLPLRAGTGTPPLVREGS
jgi:ribonuclease-3